MDLIHITTKDYLALNEYYKQLLQYLASYNQTILGRTADVFYSFQLYCELLNSGKFSFNNSFVFDTTSNYFVFPNMKDGIQVMAGFGCCRHVNSFLFDFLKRCNYNSCYEQLMHLSDDSISFQKDKGFNHIAVLYQDLQNHYILDAFNQWILKMNEDNSLTEIPFSINQDDFILRDYNDSGLSENIGKILQKYNCLRKLGIHYFYDDAF